MYSVIQFLHLQNVEVLLCFGTLRSQGIVSVIVWIWRFAYKEGREPRKSRERTLQDISPQIIKGTCKFLCPVVMHAERSVEMGEQDNQTPSLYSPGSLESWVLFGEVQILRV